MGGLLSHHSKKEKHATTTKKQPGGTISATDRAVLDLKNSRDKLSRYRTKLNTDQQKLLQRASTLNKEGNKTAALQLLKLRKHKLKEAEHVENQLLNVLQMVDTIQTKENEMDMLAAMKEGKTALEALHKEISVDEILDLMEDMREQGEFNKEISSILGSGAVDLDAVAEAEVEEELAQLEKEMEEEVVKKTEEELPVVPDGKLPELPEKKQEEQQEVVGEKRKVAVPA